MLVFAYQVKSIQFTFSISTDAYACIHNIHVRLRDHCVTVAACVTFRLVRIAIETQTRPYPIVFNQVHGVSSLATFKGDNRTVWGLEMHRIRNIGETLLPNVDANASLKRHGNVPHMQ